MLTSITNELLQLGVCGNLYGDLSSTCLQTVHETLKRTAKENIYGAKL